MVRGEPGQVVVRAELGGEGVQQPGGTRTPGLAGDQGIIGPTGGHAKRARAVGGQRRAPDAARRVDAVGGIAAAAAVGGEGEPDVDAERGLPLAPQSRVLVGRGRLGGGHRVTAAGWVAVTASARLLGSGSPGGRGRWVAVTGWSRLRSRGSAGGGGGWVAIRCVRR